MTNAELLRTFGRETARALQAHYDLVEILLAWRQALAHGDVRDAALLTDLYDLRNGLPWDWRIAEEGA